MHNIDLRQSVRGISLIKGFAQRQFFFMIIFIKSIFNNFTYIGVWSICISSFTFNNFYVGINKTYIYFKMWFYFG